ncbi:unnamed protein product [Gongylonema pulchrum]|uniref:Helicase C-terminal domain-containing protein n=1 Tax=Gongylonema pulchrum TaxID=637853 RepID=A0A183EF26_9BILA|nr:unnamed protein product [Gongylonema pulchrum]
MSRGIDVEDIDTVINYDKPQNERLFVHRVGRTARCGKKGTAVSLVTSREQRELQSILQKVTVATKVKEKSFEGVKDAETEERYRQALNTLKETVQTFQKESAKL